VGLGPILLFGVQAADTVAAMLNRREFLGITAGAGASFALSPELLSALQ